VDEIELLRLLDNIQCSMHRLDNVLAELEVVLWADHGMKIQKQPGRNPIDVI
jgi:hypothetical protein